MIQYKLIENFLGQEENSKIVEYILQQEDWNKSYTIGGNMDHWRQSKNISLKNENCPILMNKIESMFPEMMSIFYKKKKQKLNSTEIQLTRSSDGDFYKAHPDWVEDAGYYSTRNVTFVYYVHKIPKLFSGGNIRMYEHVDKPVLGRMYKMSKYIDFEPNNDTLLLFPSHQWHEVLPVRCKFDWTYSRFTINGWMH